MNIRLLNIHSHPLTGNFLESAFVLENKSSYEEYFVLPNGTVGLYVILNGDGFHTENNHLQKLPSIGICGLNNRRRLNALSPKYKVLGFRFKPEFLQLFLKERISEFKMHFIDLHDLLHDTADSLHQKLAAAGDETKIMETINDFMSRNLWAEKIDSRLTYALQKIRKGEVHNIEELSRQLNISSTSLRTHFKINVGVSPKELIHVTRLQRALKSKIKKEESLTQLAYGLGYYDQSHFIHEFKDALGITPHKYFSNNNLTFDFYNFGRWRIDSFAN